ncbi:hypothetical protein ACPOL_5473 [Acidisarcina polymorpha]|uniref:Resolvase/invertase-type recombinase catalytic domain-containing protein n=1 Tax=Acidisarcina polymorpha TaxID=2211140 RepID=A0A2Z5G6J7_9BACT|nr:recombinase family protein [Acidisarcina polymorpha]AXC14721.1 hypothetical protein ACPOL_5473 [Acidisarcina polymorpha]
MPEFVAYCRVSTDRQGESGLALDAQRTAVARFIQGASLLGEFQEIESGKNHTNQPQLTAALARCRTSRGTLVIAKLNRQSHMYTSRPRDDRRIALRMRISSGTGWSIIS